MSSVTVRPMNSGEFETWQAAIAEEYAAEQIAAGRWKPEGAVQRARDENSQLLPEGVSTSRMLLLRGVDADGEPVGRAWVGLDHPHGIPTAAFLYDIEVMESKRGRGLGRALLTAVEDATRRGGSTSLELNVFGHNHAAIALYGSADYRLTTQQMRKML